MNNKQGAVITVGRFQPPTIGHELLANQVIQSAARKGFDPWLFTFSTQDAKKNPIKFTDKVKFLKKLFPKINVGDDPKVNNPFKAIEQILDMGYKRLVVVVGSDRAEEFRKRIQIQIDKGNYDLDAFKVEVAGQKRTGAKDADTNNLASISGTNIRKLAVDGDFEGFAEGIAGKNKSLKKQIYNAVRKGMGINENVLTFSDFISNGVVCEKPSVIEDIEEMKYTNKDSIVLHENLSRKECIQMVRDLAEWHDPTEYGLRGFVTSEGNGSVHILESVYGITHRELLEKMKNSNAVPILYYPFEQKVVISDSYLDIFKTDITKDQIIEKAETLSQNRFMHKLTGTLRPTIKLFDGRMLAGENIE